MYMNKQLKTQNNTHKLYILICMNQVKTKKEKKTKLLNMNIFNIKKQNKQTKIRRNYPMIGFMVEMELKPKLHVQLVTREQLH